ncbi:MAG TPA: hypothetical protein VFC47_05075 [Caulobacteraceae bacterium]|nr:hypothetical protein [Caulobacteraceae bacterium]
MSRHRIVKHLRVVSLAGGAGVHYVTVQDRRTGRARTGRGGSFAQAREAATERLAEEVRDASDRRHR